MLDPKEAPNRLLSLHIFTPHKMKQTEKIRETHWFAVNSKPVHDAPMEAQVSLQAAKLGCGACTTGRRCSRATARPEKWISGAAVEKAGGNRGCGVHSKAREFDESSKVASGSNPRKISRVFSL